MYDKILAFAVFHIGIFGEFNVTLYVHSQWRFRV